MDRPWRKLNEELIFDGYRKVLRRQFVLPDGSLADFEVIHQPDIVCIFPITADERVILARQFRSGPEQYLSELPGGGIEPDEEPAMAAARELLEETGYVGELRLLRQSFVSGYSTATRFHFLATMCQQISAHPDNPDLNEETEPIVVPLADFKLILQKGDLTDSETAYAALSYLGR